MSRKRGLNRLMRRFLKQTGQKPPEHGISYPCSDKPDLSESCLWNRVISASAPRMTAHNTADCQVETFEYTVLAECLKSVLGTSGSKPACRRLEWRNTELIEFYQQYKRKNQDFSQSRSFLCRVFMFRVVHCIPAFSDSAAESDLG